MINQYGADATRWYLISNADPWENLKFDLMVLQKFEIKFLERFIIPIPFFAIYANIDQFQYDASKALPQSIRFPKWINGLFRDYNP